MRWHGVREKPPPIIFDRISAPYKLSYYGTLWVPVVYSFWSKHLWLPLKLPMWLPFGLPVTCSPLANCTLAAFVNSVHFRSNKQFFNVQYISVGRLVIFITYIYYILFIWSLFTKFGLWNSHRIQIQRIQIVGRFSCQLLPSKSSRHHSEFEQATAMDGSFRLLTYSERNTLNVWRKY